MQVQLDKIYTLTSSLEDAWQNLQNIELVAGCMPGAEITEKTDESHYKGKVNVKIGPMKMAFNGDLSIEDIDEGKRQIHLIADGKDKKGTSSAKMDLTARVSHGENQTTELSGEATVTVNGTLANFGGRMMTQVADQILNQFIENFSGTLKRSDVEPDAIKSSEHPTRPNELNGLKLVWLAFIAFINNIFEKKSSR